MNITDRVMIQIVGSIGVHQAEVVRLRPDGEPYLSVLDEEGWPILKPGDYVLMEVSNDRTEVIKVVGDMLLIAQLAMPDSYFHSDRRVMRAKALVMRLQAQECLEKRKL